MKILTKENVGFVLIVFWIFGVIGNGGLGLHAPTSAEAIGFDFGTLAPPVIGVVLIIAGRRKKMLR